jgi:hypothetical protein
MPRGRRTSGAALVDALGGSLEAKRRLKLALETLSGAKRVVDACKELGLCEALFYRYRPHASALGRSHTAIPTAARSSRTAFFVSGEGVFLYNQSFKKRTRSDRQSLDNLLSFFCHLCHN